MPSVPEQIIADCLSGLPDGTVTAVGERERYANASANRVVAIPRGASVIRMPDRVGDGMYTDQGRILLVREFAIDFECHGVPVAEGPTDFTVAEQLYLATIIAVRETVHNSVEFSNELWLDQQDNADGYERWGSVIKFTATINLPIYEPRSPLVTLTGTQQITTTVVLNDDTADEVIITEGM